MQNNPLRHWILCGVFFVGVGLALDAGASGTLSPGGGSDPSEQGRRIYLKKIACADCPIPGGVTDKEAAIALVERIEDQEFSLSDRERKSIVRYLNRRWRLN